MNIGLIALVPPIARMTCWNKGNLERSLGGAHFEVQVWTLFASWFRDLTTITLGSRRLKPSQLLKKRELRRNYFDNKPLLGRRSSDKCQVKVREFCGNKRACEPKKSRLSYLQFLIGETKFSWFWSGVHHWFQGPGSRTHKSVRRVVAKEQSSSALFWRWSVHCTLYRSPLEKQAPARFSKMSLSCKCLNVWWILQCLISSVRYELLLPS